MKKLIAVILIVLCASLFVQGATQKSKENNVPKPDDPNEPVTRSYVLKHVLPERVYDALKQYIYDASFDKRSNVITVKIPRKNVKDFEKMLNLVDVEKQKAMLRVFTVLASKDGKPSAIENKDLKKVLTELQKVLSFNTFRVDGVSALTITDGQRDSLLKLTSMYNLELILRDIHIRKGMAGNSVGFSFSLKQITGRTADNKTVVENLVFSTTSVKENGFLVAGVSKIGKNGDSLVLVINAQML